MVSSGGKRLLKDGLECGMLQPGMPFVPDFSLCDSTLFFISRGRVLPICSPTSVVAGAKFLHQV
jgi:hypothetical protein